MPLIKTSLQYPYDSLVDRIWSTIAHMRFLQEKTSIPVPHVCYCFLEGVDILGENCPWIIQERIPGIPLYHDIGGLSVSEIQAIGHQRGNSVSRSSFSSFQFNWSSSYHRERRTRRYSDGRIWPRRQSTSRGPLFFPISHE